MYLDKRWVLVAGISLVVAGFIAGQIGLAAGAPSPGSYEDPLVSQSYIDKYVRQEVVTLSKGQQLVAAAGTEIIVRMGRAIAVDSEQGGLSNVTAGRDIKGGETIPLNHLIIIPRDDGRGFLVDSATVIIMIRGPYEIQ